MAAGRIPATGQIVNVAGPLGTEAPKPHSEILYVNKVGDDGWLQARLGDSLTRSLCKYTKVKVFESKRGRTYFKVLDGWSAGSTLSLSDIHAREYLGNKSSIAGRLEIVVTYGKYEAQWVSKARDNEKFDQQWAKLATASGLVVNVTMNGKVMNMICVIGVILLPLLHLKKKLH